MKSIIIVIAFILINLKLLGQKKPLDHSVYDGWPAIENPQISSDGKHITFYVSSKEMGSELVVEATDSSWRKEIMGAENSIITEDGKRLICKLPNDSLGIFELGNDKSVKIPNIANYAVPKDGDGKWLAYEYKEPNRDLVVKNLWDGHEKRYGGVDDFLFSENGQSLAILLDSIKGTTSGREVMWVNLSEQKSSIICQDCNARNFVFDKNGNQLAFISMVKDSIGTKSNVLKYYITGMDKAETKIDASTRGMEGMGLVSGGLSFSEDGNNLFFYVRYLPDEKINKTKRTPEHLTIWSYKNKLLESHNYMHYDRNFAGLVNLRSNQFVKLESDSDVFNAHGRQSYFHNYVLVMGNCVGNLSEFDWRPTSRPSLYLVSTVDGSKKMVRRETVDCSFEFSTSGKYVIWYDRTQRHWYTYNIQTGVRKNITEKIDVPLYREVGYIRFPWEEGIAGWLVDDEAVLIYDRYDIWEVDPNGIKPPVNITLGFGRRNKFRLRYLDFDQDHPCAFERWDTLLLSVFDLVTKNNGFMKLNLGPGEKLIKHTMFSKTYYFPYRYSPDYSGDTDPFFPLKARHARAYLFKGMSATEYPNLFITFDFEKFRPLTNLEPQKVFNWYTSELLHWTLLNGKKAEGILYKPENFNARKKYPLIFYYYERFGDAVHAFLKPELSVGPLNIPWFVSNGYLVFVPDIYFEKGYPGKSAYNSVVSAANFLARMPWVDNKKMGIEGHSFGGFETNYIVSHTSIFAAAATAAGMSNLISEAGVVKNKSGNHEYYEIRQGRIGASLWQRPELYIENSPIFSADKVNTPLLILHSQLDLSVNISQGVEWFTALRRLGKKVWMLQYDNEGHQLSDESNQLDFTIRLSQFFDHFLKGAPAPEWMTSDLDTLDAENYSIFDMDTTGKLP